MLGNFFDFNIFADFPFKNDFYIEQWSNFWKTLQAKTSFRLDPKGLIKSMANYKKLGLVRRGLRKLNVEKSRLVQLPAQFLSFFAFERASKLGGTSTSEFIFKLSNSIWSISTVIQNLSSQVQPSRTSFSPKKMAPKVLPYFCQPHRWRSSW